MSAKKHFRKAMAVVGVAVGFSLFAITDANAAPDPNFHIYIAYGQSNMEGNATNFTDKDKKEHPRVKMFATTSCPRLNRPTVGEMYPAVPPMFKCDQGLSPADWFGRNMADSLPNVTIGIIPVAQGGTSIRLFDPDDYKNYINSAADWLKNGVKAYGNDGNAMGRIIEVAKKAQEKGVIKGIIFHQGETDAGDGQWPSKVKKVYDNIIKDLGLENDIPFLAGEVLRSGVSKGANNNIAKLPQQSKNFYVVSSEGFNQALGDGQNVHFTSQEYRDFGKRYAEKMIEVLGDNLKPVAESSSSVAESSSSEEASSSSEATSSAVDESSSSENGMGIAQIEHFGTGSLSVTKSGNVQLSLAKAEQLTVKIYSSLGKEVLDLSGNYAGTNTLMLAGRLPAGRYVVSAQGESFKAIKAVMVK